MSAQETEEKKEGWIVYPIGSKPKWPLAIMLGIQQYLTMFGATVLIPFIIGGAIGMPPAQLALLISTMFFCIGNLYPYSAVTSWQQASCCSGRNFFILGTSICHYWDGCRKKTDWR